MDPHTPQLLGLHAPVEGCGIPQSWGWGSGHELTPCWGFAAQGAAREELAADERKPIPTTRVLQKPPLGSLPLWTEPP